MRIKRIVLLSFVFSCTIQSMHGRINETVAEHRSLFTGQLSDAWENPALNRYRFKNSLTQIRAGGEYSDDRYGGSFRADTYMKLEKMNVTGFAEYMNTYRTSGQLTEVSDEKIVGPYLTYASGDGTMKTERYGFGGSYAALLGNWSVGISGSYIAGLHYRTVDPRPRNITGNLHICAGASLRLSQRYSVSACAIYRKYKQTSKLMFVSELGKNQIYHLTGLGTTYARFNDQGESVYYKGFETGGSLGLFPLTEGIYTFLNYRYLSLTQILTDLNKLPLTRTSTPGWEGTAGWRSRDWMAGLTGSWERRHGSENIFGDAVSGQYPEIGSQTLYSRTRRSAGVSAVIRKGKFSGRLVSSWEAMTEQHILPAKKIRWQRIFSEADIYRWFPIGEHGFIGTKLGLTLSAPLSSEVSGILPATEGLEAVADDIIRTVNRMSEWRCGGEASVEILFPVKSKFMVGGEVNYRHTTDGHDTLTGAIEFMF